MGGLVYGLGSSLNAATGFLLLPVVIRYLSPEAYGRVALVEVILGLLLVTLGLGINVRLLALYPGLSDGDKRETIEQLAGLATVAAVVLASLFLALALGFGSGAFPGLTSGHFVVVTVLGVLEAITIFYAAVLRASGRAWEYIRLTIVQTGVAIAASIALVIGRGLSDFGVLGGRICGDIAALMTIAPLIREYRPSFGFMGKIKALLGAFPVVPAALASVWIAAAPRVFLDHLVGTSAVGVFAFVSRIAGVLSILVVQPFALAWHPVMFTVHRQADGPKVLGRMVVGYLLVGLFSGVGLILLASIARPILSGGAYGFSLELLVTLVLANVAVGLAQAVNIGPYVANRLGSQVPVYVCGALLAAVLSVILIREWGATGAGAALLLTYVVLALGLHLVSQRQFRVLLDYRLLAAGIWIIASSAWASSWFPIDGKVGIARLLPVASYLIAAFAQAAAFLWIKQLLAGEPRTSSS